MTQSSLLEICQRRAFSGPNRWAGMPMFEALVDPGPWGGIRLAANPAVASRLQTLQESLAAIPYELSVELSAAGLQLPAGSTLDGLLESDAPLGAVMEWLLRSLLTAAGTPPRVSRWVEEPGSGRFWLAVESEEEALANACLETARRWLGSCLHPAAVPAPDCAADLRALVDVADTVRLGPSTRAIVRAAVARGIPTRRVGSQSLVQLGEGACRRRIWTAETDATGTIAEAIAQDKEMTRRLLRQVGVPVPQGCAAATVEEACAAAAALGYPVVVKPRDANHGRGISFGVRNEQEVREAFALAVRENHTASGGAIIEQFAQGVAHRVLVVGDRVVAAARGQHDTVEGDGNRTIAALVEAANNDPLRGENYTDLLGVMKLDEVAISLLKRHGLAPDSVPRTGQRVVIKVNGDLTTDETDEVHPEVAQSMVLAAQAIGLDIAGIDLVAEDISRPLEGQRGMVIEVNAGPGMFMHIAPLHGRPRPVGEAIVSLMFPPHSHGRIPIHVVADGPAAEAIARGLAQILRRQGCRAGLATVEGIDIDGQVPYLFSGGDSERMLAVLTHPHAEAAVVVSRGAERLAHGLGVPRCDVAVLADHFPAAADPASGSIDPATMTLLHALGDRGMAVVAAGSAGAEQVIYQLSICQAGDGQSLPAKHRAVVVGEAENPLLLAHRRAGGPTVTRAGSRVLLVQGAAETALDLPGLGTGAASGSPEPLLLAVAAAWAGGYSPTQLQHMG